MLTIDLSDKTILITGALGGIGVEGVVPRLLEAGARLIITDVKAPELAAETLRSWDRFRGQFEYRPLDIMDAGRIATVIRDIFQAHPNINVALGHAGGCPLHPFASTAREEFDRILHFNLTAQTHFARAVLPEWTQRGTPGAHLIFTSSFVARLPWTGIPAYCAAKAGLEMFAKCLALEYAPQGIRVNCLAPGNVAAGSSKLVYETDQNYRQTIDRISPLGKRNSPQGIGDAFVFLCSHLADEMDGHVLEVDAGVGLPKLV